MCSEPVMRTPASGFCGAYFSRIAIRPGISFSAMEISFLPKSARDVGDFVIRFGAFDCRCFHKFFKVLSDSADLRSLAAEGVLTGA